MNNPRRIQRHLVKALAAGALLAAAALPMAIATAAGAASPPVLTGFTTTPAAIGAGGSGTVAFSGTGFAYDGGAATLATTATGVTFTSVAETSTSAGTADITTSATTAPGSYSVTLTDDNGTSTALAGVLTIDADPTVTGISISTVAQSQATASLTITGTGFTAASVTVADATTGADIVNSFTLTNSTTLTGTITGTNVTGGAPATVGAYDITVTNTDGGSGELTGAFSVVASGITNVSPSEVAVSTAATPITIAGAGFEPGAVVTVSGGAGDCVLSTGSPTSAESYIIPGDTVVGSPSSITTDIDSGSAAARCTVNVQNPAVSAGGNDALITLAAALGVGEAATGTAAITATALSPNSPITPGTSSTTPETLTITGTGFGSGSTVEFFNGTSTTDDSAVTATCTVNSAGTTLTCPVVVGSGAVAGVDGVEVFNNSVASAESAAALTVAGPALASTSPTALAVHAKVGTVVTFTGTGLSSSAVVSSITGGTGLAGVFAVTSPTTATFTVTTSPTTAGTAVFNVSQTVSSGVTVAATPYSLKIDADPTVTTLVNTATGVDSVGAGAVNVPITITGTNFGAGATVGSFVNAYGVADAGVTFTAGTVTSTKITGTLTIAATDANLSDGYTVTNTDGGTVSVPGFGSSSLYIAVAPTITSVTPATGTASSTTSFAIAGTNFATGAVVTLSPANGTCGTTTVSSSTTLAVTCTLGLPSSVATVLVVTNPNGGQAESAAVLPASVAKAPVFHVSGVHGAAVVGKTVTITISGTGFYGQPKITSTAVGSKFGVSKDTGRLLTVRATIKAGTKAGEHTLTVRLANGKTGKAGFNIKK